jgi:hypothetical protein
MKTVPSPRNNRTSGLKQLTVVALSASIVYLAAGLVTIDLGGPHAYSYEILLPLIFPLTFVCEILSRLAGWGGVLGGGMAIPLCWISSALVCFLLGLWILGLIRRKQRGAYLAKSACVFLVYAMLFAAWCHRDRIWINLQMRNSGMVRADCLKLIEKYKSTARDESKDMILPRSKLPPSLIAIGATSAWVTSDTVEINLAREHSMARDGFLYVAVPVDLANEPPGIEMVRPTIYRDFYEYRGMSE